jgi:hypothetical protein
MVADVDLRDARTVWDLHGRLGPRDAGPPAADGLQIDEALDRGSRQVRGEGAVS